MHSILSIVMLSVDYFMSDILKGLPWFDTAIGINQTIHTLLVFVSTIGIYQTVLWLVFVSTIGIYQRVNTLVGLCFHNRDL